jgi:hypothetical protein
VEYAIATAEAKDLVRAERQGVGETLDKLLDALEAIRQTDEEGMDYWSARDLAPLLGYARWENFDATLTRAKTACVNVGESVDGHFRETTKMVTIGSGAQRPHRWTGS